MSLPIRIHKPFRPPLQRKPQNTEKVDPRDNTSSDASPGDNGQVGVHSDPVGAVKQTHKRTREENEASDYTPLRDSVKVWRQYQSKNDKEEGPSSRVDTGPVRSSSKTDRAPESVPQVDSEPPTKRRPTPRPKATGPGLDAAHTVKKATGIASLVEKIDRLQSQLTPETCKEEWIQNDIGSVKLSVAALRESCNKDSRNLSEEERKSIDAGCVLLWNRTVFIAASAVSAHDMARLVVANCRHIAFRLLQLAVPTCDDKEASTRLLSLGAKSAISLKEAGEDDKAIAIARDCHQYEDKILQSTAQSAIEARTIFGLALSALECKGPSEEDANLLCSALAKSTKSGEVTIGFYNAIRQTFAFVEKRLSRDGAALDYDSRISSLTEVFATLEGVEKALKACKTGRDDSLASVQSAAQVYAIRAKYEEATLKGDTAVYGELLSRLHELFFVLEGAEKRKIPVIIVQLLCTAHCTDSDFERAWNDVLQHFELKDDSIDYLRKAINAIVDKLDDTRLDITMSALQHMTSKLMAGTALLTSSAASIGHLWLPILRRVQPRHTVILRKLFDELESAGRIELSRELALAWQMAIDEAVAGLPSSDAGGNHLPLLELGAHPIFHCVQENAAKFRRRAAMCCAEQGHFPEALQQLVKCPEQQDTKTQALYVWLYAQQGREVEATRSLETLGAGESIDANTLRWLLETADTKNLPQLKEDCLKLLLQSPSAGDSLKIRVSQTRSVLQLLFQRARSGSTTWSKEHPKALELLMNLTSSITAKLGVELEDQDMWLELDWIAKATYNVSVEMTISMTTEERQELSEAVLAFVQQQRNVDIPLETDVKLVRLWAGMNVSNYYLVRSESSDDTEDLFSGLGLSQICLSYAEDAKSGASPVFEIHKVIEILSLQQADILVKLGEWDELIGFIRTAALQIGFEGLQSIVETAFGSSRVPFRVSCAAVQCIVEAAIAMAEEVDSLNPQPIQIWLHLLLDCFAAKEATPADELALITLLQQKIVPLVASKTVAVVPAWARQEMQWLHNKLWHWKKVATSKKSQLALTLHDIIPVLAEAGGLPTASEAAHKAEREQLQAQLQATGKL